MLLDKNRKNENIAKGNRLLISVTVVSSAGPIRFLVNEQELVAAVIDTTLKSYAREGRLPVLGSNINDFLLYCPNTRPDGGVRNFMLYKKPVKMENDETPAAAAITRKGSGRTWKAWINKKSLNLKISSH
ncbi:hypothetical protein D8674_041084 [Pyrus ussuriensis x Pyrus communis]|uniref:DUF7054 domain-containing protein n=1 Tax=Pyrus ussuriensis x Pyrus communis TaxID=2448454 RepID=A0A5N5HE78_9ROSA|nr:hypothetical protein D8674_041084 [Pyrus ussuriensis x Pyrus communis]